MRVPCAGRMHGLAVRVQIQRERLDTALTVMTSEQRELAVVVHRQTKRSGIQHQPTSAVVVNITVEQDVLPHRRSLLRLHHRKTRGTRRYRQAIAAVLAVLDEVMKRPTRFAHVVVIGANQTRR